LHQMNDAVALATEQQFAAWVGTANIVLGSVFSAPGEGARGLAMAQAGYAKYAAAAGAPNTATGQVLNMTFYLALLASACEGAGVPADARAYLDAAIAAAERSGERWFEPELHRLKGEWLLRHDPGRETEAEAAFAHAIDLAARQTARFWELRASASLARLYVVRGCPDRARDTLAPVYEWFREGLDWPDLQQAGELLASLPA
jgi:predicted ATPase